MTRLLITGGSSYLGQHLVPLALKQFDTTYTYFQNDPLQLSQGVKLDLRDETAVFHLVQQTQPDIILHLAGSNRGSDMENVIRLGTQAIVTAASHQQSRLIHLSTDSIFKGDAAPYNEDAAPSPVNAYGFAKADAETMAQQYANHVIVRTSLIYGLHKMDWGTNWMSQALADGKPVTLFNNQMRNPVWVDSLCLACLELCSHSFTGIINVAGQQVMTRAQFALKMLDWWQVQPRDTLTIAPSQGNQWPLDCELDLELATAVLNTSLPGVDQTLKNAASSATLT
ncbi:MAG: NAD-dependent epimerase/dehydratase family protein [Chloroflexi bacterium]|nr:MAG: NAD-dependent epimerase/dehydratase family protein [Chloroflexota bacterium]